MSYFMFKKRPISRVTHVKMVAKRHLGEGGGCELCSDAVNIILHYRDLYFNTLVTFLFIFLRIKKTRRGENKKRCFGLFIWW